MVIRILTLSITILSFFSALSQNYAFIPNDYRMLNEEEMEKIQIVIKPGISLYNDTGEKLPMSQLSLMTNQEYRPRFFVNANYDIKAIVFENKQSNPIIVKRNSIESTAFVTGEKALDFITQDQNGNSIKLSELRGNVVVLNFWFVKCGPCIAEMPALNNLKEQFKNQKVTFLAITFDKLEMVNQLLETKLFNYQIISDASHVIQMYGVQSFPTNIVIDKNGYVELKETGFRTNIREVLAASISKSLQ
jgi:peroxiredoxin